MTCISEEDKRVLESLAEQASDRGSLSEPAYSLLLSALQTAYVLGSVSTARNETVKDCGFPPISKIFVAIDRNWNPSNSIGIAYANDGVAVADMKTTITQYGRQLAEFRYVRDVPLR